MPPGRCRLLQARLISSAGGDFACMSVQYRIGLLWQMTLHAFLLEQTEVLHTLTGRTVGPLRVFFLVSKGTESGCVG
jgi:hypothetical protein